MILKTKVYVPLNVQKIEPSFSTCSLDWPLCHTFWCSQTPYIDKCLFMPFTMHQKHLVGRWRWLSLFIVRGKASWPDAVGTVPNHKQLLIPWIWGTRTWPDCYYLLFLFIYCKILSLLIRFCSLVVINQLHNWSNWILEVMALRIVQNTSCYSQKKKKTKKLMV